MSARPIAHQRSFSPNLTCRGAFAWPETTPNGASASAQADGPLARLLESGVALLTELARAARAPVGEGSLGAQGPLKVVRDAKTGETFVRVRVPDAEVLNRAVEAAAGLLESLRRESR